MLFWASLAKMASMDRRHPRHLPYICDLPECPISGTARSRPARLYRAAAPALAGPWRKHDTREHEMAASQGLAKCQTSELLFERTRNTSSAWSELGAHTQSL